MKILIGGLFALVLQIAAAPRVNAQSSATTELNGSSWDVFTTSEHTMYVKGFADGYSLSYGLARSSKPSDGDESSNSETEMEKLFLRNSQRAAGAGKPSNGEEVGEITRFYADFRNAPVCWSDAAAIANLTLKGAAPSDSELDAVRSEDAKKGCAP